MLDFIYISSTDLFGAYKELKIQNENICFQRDSNPHHPIPRQVTQRLGPLDNRALMMNTDLMSNRVMGLH